jgi:hypothetical protein
LDVCVGEKFKRIEKSTNAQKLSNASLILLALLVSEQLLKNTKKESKVT